MRLTVLAGLLPFVLAAVAASTSSSGTSSASSTTTSASTTTSSTYPTETVANAVVAGQYDYEYVGCWNETTGYANGGNVRAISSGSMIDNTTQTIETCLTFCHEQSYQFCGLEYGSECWGGEYLSTLSTKLPAAACWIGCAGNDTQTCGGDLTLTLYNITGTSTSSTNSSGDADAEGAGTKEAAGVLGALVLAVALGAAFSAF